MLVKKVVVEKANRLYQLAPEVNSFLPATLRRSLVRRTEALDLATFAWPVRADVDISQQASSLLPASEERLGQLREQIAQWFQIYHGVEIDPAKEVFVGGGISSLVFTIALSFIDFGDVVFVPEIGVSLYRRVTTACSGEAVKYTVSPKDEWQPKFDRIRTRAGRVARLLFLNSPHNPTGAELGEKEMTNLVWLAGKENLIIVNDAAYAGVPSRKHVSLLAVKGGKRVGVEVYSMPYGFGLPALPFGFVVGNREVIEGVKLASRLLPHTIPDQYIDLGLTAIRQFPSEQLRAGREYFARNMAEGLKLLDLLGLQNAGFDSVPFIWARIERRYPAATAASLLYRRSRILALPSTAFGDSGEGFLRFSLTALPETFSAAIERLRKLRQPIRLGAEL
ncbi:MAG TPA: pyridoxal phosphate-dependent aminotransferase [Candidatus Deferrimicrobium sp.]|nr:pyridoxal phosphate-dependent aminotransferase [Candidatus Deferrimicrobium sp.]